MPQVGIFFPPQTRLLFGGCIAHLSYFTDAVIYAEFSSLLLQNITLANVTARWRGGWHCCKKVLGSGPGWGGVSVWSLHVVLVSAWVALG